MSGNLHKGQNLEVYKAAANGSFEKLKRLLESGASANGQDTDGQPALDTASSKGRTKLIMLLLEHGADPNIRWGDNNDSVVCKAINNNHETTALALLESGKCSQKIKDEALMLAQEKKLRAVISFFVTNEDSKWIKTGENKLLHTFNEVSLKLKISDIFDFQRQEKFSVVVNMQTDSDLIIRKDFSEVSERELTEAIDQFKELGGEVNAHNILSSIVKKTSKQKPSKIAV